MKMSEVFRKRLAAPGVVAAPGVYDALSARICEMAGFEVLQHSGYGTAASLLGRPDVGLLSFTEMRDQLHNIAKAVHIPVIGDADNGFGNAVNVDRTVREYFWAGVAGLFMEDQVLPKRCGHMAGKKIISTEEMMGKLRCALNARDQEDPSGVIIYRTDAVAVTGIDDAIDRAKRAVDVGVDMVFVEALETMEQMERVAKEVNAPLMLNLVEGGKTPLVSLSEAEAIGFKYVIYPVTTVFAAAKAMMDVMTMVKRDGLTEALLDHLVDFKGFGEIVGADKIQKMEESYLPSDEMKKYGGSSGIVG